MTFVRKQSSCYNTLFFSHKPKGWNSRHLSVGQIILIFTVEGKIDMATDEGS